METDTAVHNGEGQGLDKNLISGYEQAGAFSTFSDVPFFPDTYYSAPAGGAEWSGPIDFSSSSPVVPLTPMSYLDDGFVSPDMWGAETDAESAEPDIFSPMVDRASPGWDAVPPLKRSWSGDSSPILSSPVLESKPEPIKQRKAPATSATKGNAKKAKQQDSKETKLRTSRKTRKSKAAVSVPAAGIKTEGDDDDTLSPEDRRARSNHNLVEKQYRNRLNAQFERLLDVLPTEPEQRHQELGGQPPEKRRCIIAKGEAKGRNGDSLEDKRVSKAEVLDMATRRIKLLEADRRRLQQERKELLRSIEMISGLISTSSRGRGVLGLAT